MPKSEYGEAIREGASGGNRKRQHRHPSVSFESFSRFLTKHIRTDRGGFTWQGYRPLKDVCEAVVDPANEQVDVVKPTQKGFTTALGFGFPLWQMHRNGRNVGYFLPTNDMAKAILKSRLRPAIHGSDIQAEVRDTPGDGLVLVGEKRMIVLGLDSVRAAISWPMDVVVYDEVDDLNQEHVGIARQRLDASDYGHEVAFCCGRFPGEGIHGRYLKGDQRRWLVTCGRCRHEQILEDHWPDNCLRVGSKWHLICTKCRAVLNPERMGQFVAQRDARSANGRVSFQVSALAFGCTDIGRIMREWEQAQGDRKALANFRCSKLGLPDAGDRQAIDAAVLARAARPPALASPPFFVGVDTGDFCHISVCGMVAEGIEFVRFERVRGEDLLDRLGVLDGQMLIDGFLVDQRPEGSLARAVCRRFPSRAYLQEFRADEGEKDKEFEGEVFNRLQMEREDIISHFFDRVTGGSIWFPEKCEGLDFHQSTPGRHILKGAEKEEKTDRNGLTVRKFRSGNVENHYLMSSVFGMAIAQRMHGRSDAVNEVRVSTTKRRTAEMGPVKRVMSGIRGFLG